MTEVTSKELANKVLGKINFLGECSMAKEFVSAILDNHPTLQQRFMSEIVIRFIREVANKDPNQFDGRNQMMKEICDNLFGVLKIENKDTGLPMI